MRNDHILSLLIKYGPKQGESRPLSLFLSNIQYDLGLIPFNIDELKHNLKFANMEIVFKSGISFIQIVDPNKNKWKKDIKNNLLGSIEARAKRQKLLKKILQRL